MDSTKSESNKNILVNVDNKGLLKALIEIVSQFSNEEEFSLKFAVILESIFFNGLKAYDQKGKPNIRKFIVGSLFFDDKKDVRESFVSWIFSNLQTGKLSKILSFLLADTEHVNNCYEEEAFIRSEKYQNALMICLVAIEKNQLNLLAQIDPVLYDTSCSCPVKKGHKRSSSQPQMTLLTRGSAKSNHKIIRSKTLNINNDSKIIYSLKLRPWQSLPDISSVVIANRPRCSTVVSHRNSQQSIRKNSKSFNNNNIYKKMVQQNYVSKIEKIPEKPVKVPSFNYPESSELKSNNSNNTIPEIVKTEFVPEDIQNIPIFYDYRYGPQVTATTSTSSGSPSSISPKTPNKSIFSIFDSKKPKSDKISSSASPKDYWDFIGIPMPMPGEKITQKTLQVPITHVHSAENLCEDRLVERRIRKISTNYDVRNIIDSIQQDRRTDLSGLDQENAHFELSEAVIETIEQLKWNKILNEKYKMLAADTKSIKRTTIPETKHIILKNTLKTTPIKVASEPKFTIGSAGTDSDSNCSSEEYLNKERKNSQSSDSIQEHAALEWDDANEARSAESIALMLISRFSGQQKQNNLKWLIKDGETSQSMLPMSEGLIVNPDDTYTLKTFIRGTKEWAPPRKQIIFTMHPTPDRKALVKQQQHRCMGCGMKVSPSFTHRFRYCDYMGKYFCSGCHKEQKARIPARILENWDFNVYAVSVFSYKLLDQIKYSPLFHVNDLNPKLYQKVKALQQTRDKRLKLRYLEDFIDSCRHAENEQTALDKLPSHWTKDRDIWSIADFEDVKEGDMLEKIGDIIDMCETHVNNCNLCTARAFICEACSNKEIIFPWQPKVTKCPHCGTCYHDKCTPEKCYKCIRISQRLEQEKKSSKRTS